MGFTWTIAVTGNAVVSYTAFPPLPQQVRRFISVALVWESPPPDVIRHPALRSPDFPHLLPFGNCSRDYPHYSISLILIILIFCSFKYHSEYLYTKFVFRSYSNKTASIHNLTILIWLLSYYFNNNIKNLMVRHLN